jgi:tRNA threonylcarbamoyladenosine biosynthesis protein TsaE
MRAMQKALKAEEMPQEAEAFVAGLAPSDTATLIALSGDLGAGKTTFVQGVAQALGIEEHVTSPTFVIMKIYDLHGQKFDRLVHMDAYRLKGEQHLRALGWDEILRDPRNLVIVEWPEKIEGGIPAEARSITFRYSGDDTREIIYG